MYVLLYANCTTTCTCISVIDQAWGQDGLVLTKILLPAHGLGYRRNSSMNMQRKIFANIQPSWPNESGKNSIHHVANRTPVPCRTQRPVKKAERQYTAPSCHYGSQLQCHLVHLCNKPCNKIKFSFSLPVGLHSSSSGCYTWAWWRYKNVSKWIWWVPFLIFFCWILQFTVQPIIIMHALEVVKEVLT